MLSCLEEILKLSPPPASALTLSYITAMTDAHQFSADIFQYKLRRPAETRFSFTQHSCHRVTATRQGERWQVFMLSLKQFKQKEREQLHSLVRQFCLSSSIKIHSKSHYIVFNFIQRASSVPQWSGWIRGGLKSMLRSDINKHTAHLINSAGMTFKQRHIS